MHKSIFLTVAIVTSTLRVGEEKRVTKLPYTQTLTCTTTITLMATAITLLHGSI